MFADVDSMLNRKTLELKGIVVTVERYKEDYEELCTIEVHGVKDIDRNLDKVLLYFKNKKRSNGGVILKHSVDTIHNIVYITFETHEGLSDLLSVSKI